jgi:hypothetical protein
VTFGDEKKGKVLGTCVIKVNKHFTLKDVPLVDKLRYNLLLSLILLILIWMFSFANLALKCLILVVTMFVVFLTSRSFKLIFFLLSPL